MCLAVLLSALHLKAAAYCFNFLSVRSGVTVIPRNVEQQEFSLMGLHDSHHGLRFLHTAVLR